MEHILVPVDFSTDSGKALEAAAKEAKLRDASIVLLHVVETITPQDLELYPAIVSQDDVGRERAAEGRLKEVSKQYFAGINTQILVRRSIGSVYSEIVAVEQEIQASLTVISAHSRTFFEKLFLESTSSKVINSSRCPVLVVPV